MSKSPKKFKETAERTLSRSKHDLPVKLTKDEIAEQGQRLAQLLQDQGELERAHKDTKTQLKADEDKAQALVIDCAAVIRSGEEVRPVEVEIRADFKAGMVAVVRLDTGKTVTTRKLSDDERQKRLVFEDDDEAPPPKPTTPGLHSLGPSPDDLKAFWGEIKPYGEVPGRSPLPDGEP